MELIKAIWVINSFFFALVLVFIWSKSIIIAKKVSTISSIMERIEQIQLDDESPPSIPDMPAEPRKA